MAIPFSPNLLTSPQELGLTPPLAPTPVMHFPMPAQPSISPIDFDTVVRTVWGEAAREGPLGQQAVAAVILNRARQAGMSPGEVALAKNQFEPWWNSKTRPKLEGLSPDSREYQEIAANILPVFESGIDPTGGADHFYSPKGQKALGRRAPSWDDGSGADIGNHRFFSLGYGGQGRTQLAGGTPLPRDRPSAPIPQPRPQDTAPGALMAFGPQRAPGIEFPMDVFADGEAGEEAGLQLAAMEGPAPVPRSRPQPSPQQRGLIESPKQLESRMDQLGPGASAEEPVVPPSRADLEAIERELVRRGVPLEDISATEPGDRRIMQSAERGPVEGTDPVGMLFSGPTPQSEAASRGFIEGIPVAGPRINEAIDAAEAFVRSVATGQPHEEELAAMQDRVAQLQEAYPDTDWWSELAGNVAPLAAIVTRFPGVFGIGPGQGLAARLGFGGAAGGTITAADIAARGGSLEEIVGGLAAGAAIGAGGAQFGHYTGRLVERLKGNKTPLHREGAATKEIKEMGQAALSDPVVEGLTLRKNAYRALLDELEDLGTQEGVYLGNFPGVRKALNSFKRREKSADDVTWKELQVLRGTLGDVANNREALANDRRVAAMLSGQMDEFLETAGAGAYSSGDYNAALPILHEGRQLYRLASKLDVWDDAVNAARRSDEFKGPALRNEFRKLVENDKLARMFTPEEFEAFDRIANLNQTERILAAIPTLRSMMVGGAATGLLSIAIGGAPAAGVGGVVGGSALVASHFGTNAIVQRQVRDAARQLAPEKIVEHITGRKVPHLALLAPRQPGPRSQIGAAVGTGAGIGVGARSGNNLIDFSGLGNMLLGTDGGGGGF